jgi:MoaA/NifB/PqqE/SkfB family radical SAM enzyme
MSASSAPRQTKLGDLWEAYRNYRQYREFCSNKATRLWIEPTSLCNLTCGFCPNKDLPEWDKAGMEMELFRKIIDEVKEFATDINLFHRGESMIYKELPEMVRIVKAAGLTSRLHTNATLLNEKRGRALMEAGLDFLSCSFDGYDKVSYEAARTGGKYERTLGNILRFLELKKALGRRNPFVQLWVMELDDDPAALRRRKRREFLRHFDGLPINKVTIHPIHNWGGNITVPGADMVGGKRYAPCTFPWYSLTVLWSGKVTPCPQDFMGVIDLGDLTQESVAEVWNGEKMRALRGMLKDRTFPREWPCATCDRLYRKRVAGVPTDHLALFLRDNLLLRPLMAAGTLRARWSKHRTLPPAPPRVRSGGDPGNGLIQIEVK